MNGKVITIDFSKKTQKPFGFIKGTDNNQYYFNEGSLIYGLNFDSIKVGTRVVFTPTSNPDGKLMAMPVELADKDISDEIDTDIETPINDSDALNADESASTQRSMETKSSNKTEALSYDFYTAGWAQRYSNKRNIKKHIQDVAKLNDSSEVYEALDKLSRIFYITRVENHIMRGSKKDIIYPYALVGPTNFSKQFIKEKKEFLVIFSESPRKDFQERDVQVFKQILKSDIPRLPLISFYILISNARELKSKIDSRKGEAEAAIIPFSFEEILNCNTDSDLRKLFLARFEEYIFEKDMLADNKAIDLDNLLFGDRGKIADSIVDRCKENKHSGIFGLRRSGKSSVLNAVIRRLEREDIKSTVIESRELETIDSWKTGLYDIARKIKIALLPDDEKQREDENREQFDKRLNLNSTEEDYQKRAVSCFVEDIKLYTKNEKTFVIGIDEIELITYNSATSETWKSLDSYKGFWSALRDCGCALVICGVNSTINEISNIEFNGETCDNPMYERIHNCADSTKTYLPAFTDEQTKQMINTLGGYSNIAFDNVYADINREFGGQPYAIRQFCSFMFNEERNNRNLGEVYQFERATFKNLKTAFNNSTKGRELYRTMLQHIGKYYKDEYNMLIKITDSPEIFGKVNEKDIPLLDHLEKYGLVEYDRKSKYVAFKIESVQEYIKSLVTKDPLNMTNEERMDYLANKSGECEGKLKQYILNRYTYGDPEHGRSILKNNLRIKNGCIPTPNPDSCRLVDFFDHDKYIMYFSGIRDIILADWNTFKDDFRKAGLDKNKFSTYMNDLNLGRTDGDHHNNIDNKKIISDEEITDFQQAYNKMKSFFEQMSL